MDSEAFRRLYPGIDERACAFEQAILANEAGCSQACKSCIGEREGVECGSDRAQADCVAFLEILRQRARFALRETDTRSAPTHGNALRIKIGGLRGLHAALEPGEPIPRPIPDIRGRVLDALERFGDWSALPFETIVREIAAYRGRRGRNQGR